MTVTWPKNCIFKNSRWRQFKMAAAAILKFAFLAVSRRPIVRFQRNFVWGSRTAGRQGLHDKNCKFLKSNMADRRHFAIVKSSYLSEKSSDFDEIWYTASDIEPGYSHVTKNCTFWNSRWRRLPSWKSLIWSLLINRLSDFSKILYEKAERHADKGYGTKNANV